MFHLSNLGTLLFGILDNYASSLMRRLSASPYPPSIVSKDLGLG